MCFRSLLWLIAVVAFAFPPFSGAAASMASHGNASTAATTDCPDHAPPPDPCPAKGTAKHAAGDCCPMMSGTIALLPDAPTSDKQAAPSGHVAFAGAPLIGFLPTKDPPPPRT